MLTIQRAGLYDSVFASGDNIKKNKNKNKDKKSKRKGTLIVNQEDRQVPKESVPVPGLTPIIRPSTSPGGNSTKDTRRLPQNQLGNEGPSQFCRALYDYDPEVPLGLSFRKGDIIEVLSQSTSGWWDAFLGETRGWIPSTYVVLISNEEAYPHPHSPYVSTSPTDFLMGAPVGSPKTDFIYFEGETSSLLSPDDSGIRTGGPYRSPKAGNSDGDWIDGYGFEQERLRSTSRLSSSHRATQMTLKEDSMSALTLDLSLVNDIEDKLLIDSHFDVEDLDKPAAWYITRPDNPDISVEEDGTIRGGKLEALVERLTAHDRIDQNYIQTFLLTFKTFTAVDKLVDSLLARYRMEPPKQLTTIEWEEWSRLKRNVVQIRVLNILQMMIQDDDILDNEDLHVIRQITAFIQKKDVARLTAATALLNVIQRKRKHGILQEAVPHSPSSFLSHGIPNTAKLNSKMRVIDIEPSELARQLTILESGLLQGIRPFDCLKRVRGGHGEGLNNIAIVIQTSNKLADWVAGYVLSRQEPSKRAQIIKYFIDVAEKCRSLNNFSSMLAITSGLCSPPVRRLKQTWGHVNASSMAELITYEEIIDSKKNFSNYRRLMATVATPCVPFIGVFLSTLQFIEDGNPDTYTNGFINFRKRQKFAEVLSDIRRWKAHPYNLTRVPAVMDFIEESLGRLGKSTNSTSNRLWKLSLEREPREYHDNSLSTIEEDA